MVIRSRLARSLAACSTSSAMSRVVLMHQMLTHQTSRVHLYFKMGALAFNVALHSSTGGPAIIHSWFLGR